MTTAAFQRARSPEQQQERRAQILAAARNLLAERSPEDVSLRELSRAVGLAKSNVVRYFPTREAVFLAVLTTDAELWLDDAAARLAHVSARAAPQRRRARIATDVAESLADHPRFCDLLSASQSVLERNVPAETAREFKLGALAFLQRLGALVTAATGLDEAAGFEFAGYVWVLTAGAWPMSAPTPVVAAVLAEPGLEALRHDFVPAMTRAMTVMLEGLAAAAAAGL